jgi:hypothetical protein
MTHKLLLPNRFKKIGWLLLIPATIAGIFVSLQGYDSFQITIKTFALLNTQILGSREFFSIIETDITNTLVGVLFISGALLVGFSKEKNEDEYIANLRLTSLIWAVAVNYLLLLFCFLFVFGAAFLTVMVYNMFTVLIIFIVRFNYLIYKNSNTASYEK